MIEPSSYTTASLYGGEARTAGASANGRQKPADGAAFDRHLSDTNAASDARTAGETRQAASSLQKDGSGGGFFAFLKGLLDIVNPLQHIPVISTIYRSVTGDEIAPMAKMAGAAIYGGPIGAAMAVADIATQKTTGKDIGQNVMAMLDGKPEEQKTEIAAADLNNMAPASGASEIIWHTPDITNSLPPSAPTAHTEGDKPVTHIPQIARSPVFDAKNSPTPAFTAAAAEVPSRHEAPAKAARIAALPGLTAPENKSPEIAMPDIMPSKMMEGLDKYAALKKAQMHGRTAGQGYSAQF